AQDHVVAVAQGGDAAVAHEITGVGAYEAVAGIDGAADAGGTVGPGHRPAVAVPIDAIEHVVAVAQGRDREGSHALIGVGADGAVAGRDGAGDAGGAVTAGRRPANPSPVGALHHAAADPVVGVAQGDSAAAAHEITGVGADEAVAGSDGAADAGG